MGDFPAGHVSFQGGILLFYLQVWQHVYVSFGGISGTVTQFFLKFMQ